MQLAETIFSSKFERKILRAYRAFFSIQEIEEHVVLQWVYGASLLSFFVTFFVWIGSHAFTLDTVARGSHLCWSYFKECGDLSFLLTLPEGYSQTVLYMLFFACMLLAVYFMYKKEWLLAHATLLFLFLWKGLVLFVFTRHLAANYDYYHVIFTAVLLFIPLKIFFLKFIFVLLYFLASTIKFHEGWILGTYFTALKTGLPLFPEVITPVVTGLVILMQAVGAWFLLSNVPWQRMTALSYFTLFHLYSGILVKYRYPSMVLPTLLILFGLFPSKTERPTGVRAIPGWTLVALLVGLQLVAVFIPGDQKLTLEGNFFGLYMFEANHQCRSVSQIVYKDKSAETSVREGITANDRCDPYREWFAFQTKCQRDPSVSRIEWTFDHSINGGPFYRIVDVKNACPLVYRALGKNEWIMTPETGAPVVAYPVQNIFP